MFFGSVLPEAAHYVDWPPELFWAPPPLSPAVDRPSSLLGKAASAEGLDTAPKQVEVVKYISCGRNIVHQKTEFQRARRIMALLRTYLSLRVSNLEDDLAGIATGEFNRRESAQ
jgi:hypothetical protein